MALKKLLYILVSVWLINSLVCFHSSNPFEGSVSNSQSVQKHVRVPNNLLKLLASTHNGLGKDDDALPQKIKYSYRYMGSRYQSLGVVCQAFDLLKTSFCPSAELTSLASNPYYKVKRILSPDVPIFRLTPF
ncbi:hypothetical protein [Mucilaginibacter lacusdianchii]|uniref:hypothetical protein n=1 Tax=Mucilaginibacter lacusdianchii TaxID=2684211 RepID=UPI00131D4873|nr:hypothetical protein [Mucilaginibacter sp. JXJ CY 39]